MKEAVAEEPGLRACGGYLLTEISPFDGYDLSRGRFYPPTLLSWAEEPRMLDRPIWHQERFGPAVYVIAFDFEDEAIRLVNDDEFGLGASIWTKDREQAMRVSSKIERGTVWVNTHHLIDPNSPWGGMQVAMGGHGENCLEAYHSYTTTRTTFTNLATPEESLTTDDRFPKIPGGIHYDIFDSRSASEAGTETQSE